MVHCPFKSAKILWSSCQRRLMALMFNPSFSRKPWQPPFPWFQSETVLRNPSTKCKSVNQYQLLFIIIIQYIAKHQWQNIDAKKDATQKWQEECQTFRTPSPAQAPLFLDLHGREVAAFTPKDRPTRQKVSHWLPKVPTGSQSPTSVSSTQLVNGRSGLQIVWPILPEQIQPCRTPPYHNPIDLSRSNCRVLMGWRVEMAQYMILRESERYVLASGRFLYLFARLEATNMDACNIWYVQNASFELGLNDPKC